MPDILAALHTAIKALHTITEADFDVAHVKEYAQKIYQEINHAEFFDPAYGTYFAWHEDSDYSGEDLETVCDLVEPEENQIVQLTRVIQLPDIYVAVVANAEGSIEYEAFNTEEEADARITAAEAAASE